jgi:hypothetical protein
MKKVLNSILLIPAIIMFLVSCEIDNYPGPDARFFGTISDIETGELVGTELINGSTIQVVELGRESTTTQTWVIKNTGEFRNDLVFSAYYDMHLANGNFFPFSVNDFEIRPGNNEHNFSVTPYIRIINPSITHDAANNRIVATFTLQPGSPEVRLSAIRLYGFSDMYVGEAVKYNTTGAGFIQTFSPAAVIGGTQYTLTIDLAANSNFFNYTKNYYFRIGALANVAGVGTVRRNYSPTVVIPLN